MDCDGTIKLRRVKKKIRAGKKNSNLKKKRGDRKKGLVLHGGLTFHIVKPALILRKQIGTYAETTMLKSFVDLLKAGVHPFKKKKSPLSFLLVRSRGIGYLY